MRDRERYRQIAVLSGILGVATTFFVFTLFYDFSYFLIASAVYFIFAAVILYLIFKIKGKIKIEEKSKKP